MIDNFTILFSTIMVLIIIVRAGALDRKLPWFGTKDLGTGERQKPDAVASSESDSTEVTPWRRR